MRLRLVHSKPVFQTKKFPKPLINNLFLLDVSITYLLTRLFIHIINLTYPLIIQPQNYHRKHKSIHPHLQREAKANHLKKKETAAFFFFNCYN